MAARVVIAYLSKCIKHLCYWYIFERPVMNIDRSGWKCVWRTSAGVLSQMATARRTRPRPTRRPKHTPTGPSARACPTTGPTSSKSPRPCGPPSRPCTPLPRPCSPLPPPYTPLPRPCTRRPPPGAPRRRRHSRERGTRTEPRPKCEQRTPVHARAVCVCGGVNSHCILVNRGNDLKWT